MSLGINGTTGRFNREIFKSKRLCLPRKYLPSVPMPRQLHPRAEIFQQKTNKKILARVTQSIIILSSDVSKLSRSGNLGHLPPKSHYGGIVTVDALVAIFGSSFCFLRGCLGVSIL